MKFRSARSTKGKEKKKEKKEIIQLREKKFQECSDSFRIAIKILESLVEMISISRRIPIALAERLQIYYWLELDFQQSSRPVRRGKQLLAARALQLVIEGRHWSDGSADSASLSFRHQKKPIITFFPFRFHSCSLFTFPVYFIPLYPHILFLSPSRILLHATLTYSSTSATLSLHFHSDPAMRTAIPSLRYVTAKNAQSRAARKCIRQARNVRTDDRKERGHRGTWNVNMKK